MGLGSSAAVTASHIMMVLILGLGIYRIMQLRMTPRETLPLSGTWVFPTAIAFAFTAILVERIYYIAARLLQPTGIDLWGAHPAPAVLSAVVALGCYWLMPPIFYAQGMDGKSIRNRCASELSAIAVTWLLIERILT